MPAPEDWEARYTELRTAVLEFFEHRHPGVGLSEFPEPWREKAYAENLKKAKQANQRLRALVGLEKRRGP